MDTEITLKRNFIFVLFLAFSKKMLIAGIFSKFYKYLQINLEPWARRQLGIGRDKLNNIIFFYALSML